jgi:hypothetical protein
MKTGIAPSFTWGASAVLRSTGGQLTAGAQLAQVTLPEPAVCTLYFQSSIIATDDDFNSLSVFTINLLEGVGRVTVPRQISFTAQPARRSPLEFTIPFIPLHALQVNIEQKAQTVATNGFIETETYLVLAPLTRINPTGDMKFGMALPGEADEMDNELREELENESPTVQQVMYREAGALEEPEPPEVVPQAMTQAGSIVSRVIAELTERLGRPPTRPEAEQAIQRVQARLARRGVRGI